MLDLDRIELNNNTNNNNNKSLGNIHLLKNFKIGKLTKLNRITCNQISNKE